MKASYLSLGLFALVALAAGCDDISEDDRYIKVEKPAIDNPRTLLIMEFTGNSCSNCPTGAAILEQIKEEEPAGKVISVGLHPYGTNFTDPVNSLYSPTRKQDLRSEAATALFEYYRPSAFPAAVFGGTAQSTATNEWTQKASEALLVESIMDISAICRYDESSRQLTVDYSVNFLDYINSRLNITVWLVENKIMGTQTMPSGPLNLHYEHNHVLRASLNGNWGETLGEKFADEDFKEGHASMTIKDDWVAENCNVVVYVYRDDNKYVEEATSVDFKDWLPFPEEEE